MIKKTKIKYKKIYYPELIEVATTSMYIIMSILISSIIFKILDYIIYNTINIIIKH